MKHLHPHVETGDWERLGDRHGESLPVQILLQRLRQRRESQHSDGTSSDQTGSSSVRCQICSNVAWHDQSWKGFYLHRHVLPYVAWPALLSTSSHCTPRHWPPWWQRRQSSSPRRWRRRNPFQCWWRRRQAQTFRALSRRKKKIIDCQKCKVLLRREKCTYFNIIFLVVLVYSVDKQFLALRCHS